MLYFSKTRDVKSPIRANQNDAGIDFFVPYFSPEFIDDLKKLNTTLEVKESSIILRPHERALIPTGIHVNLEATKRHTNWVGIMMTAHNKSGIGTKRGLDRLAEVVDEGYQGEVHISIVNTSNDIQEISSGDKLIQFVLEEVSYLQPKEIRFSELYDSKSSRGDGGFGHTDKK